MPQPPQRLPPRGDSEEIPDTIACGWMKLDVLHNQEAQFTFPQVLTNPAASLVSVKVKKVVLES